MFCNTLADTARCGLTAAARAMGNQLTAPARVQPGELLAADVPALVYKDSLGGSSKLFCGGPLMAHCLVPTPPHISTPRPAAPPPHLPTYPPSAPAHISTRSSTPRSSALNPCRSQPAHTPPTQPPRLPIHIPNSRFLILPALVHH